ncbi:hypothetical protein EVAR_40522_1 [Eumeta japonica]|uniref:Uncharacterized protein n=1 Tax=Eumeta variegata TaxID=151549 RepID=A0A4C1SLN5_EUMVA|nr:hypothetical protein EVAR_40522_1 [Eumeta japonica]
MTTLGSRASTAGSDHWCSLIVELETIKRALAAERSSRRPAILRDLPAQPIESPPRCWPSHSALLISF